jgi:DNA repair protein RecO (recombination protein O)
MPLQKTEAIVLKSQKQGETSKILTLYTRAFGKLKMIAKGARSIRSRFGASLEPSSYISIVFYEKENRELQFLSQAEIIETFPKILKNLERTTLAMAVCELVNRLEIGTSRNPTLFRLIVETLRGIDSAAEKPINCLWAFQVKICGILGFRPNLSTCFKCGDRLASEVVFDIPHGGYFCRNCRGGKSPGIILEKEALAALRAFQHTPLANLNGYLTSTTAQQQVDDFLLAYIKYHVEGFVELKTMKFLKRIHEST